MSERSGVGQVECAILEALDLLGARPGRRHRRNVRVLAGVEERIGLAPGYAARRNSGCRPVSRSAPITAASCSRTSRRTRTPTRPCRASPARQQHVTGLPRPLPAMLRTWAGACAAEDLLTSLAALEDAVRIQSAFG